MQILDIANSPLNVSCATHQLDPQKNPACSTDRGECVGLFVGFCVGKIVGPGSVGLALGELVEVGESVGLGD